MVKISKILIICIVLVMASSCSNEREDVVSMHGKSLPRDFVNSIGVDMRLVQPGVFVSKSKYTLNEQHSVKKIYMARSEVTIGQYLKYCKDVGMEYKESDSRQLNGKSRFYDGREFLTLYTIGYRDALRFCSWLSRKEGVKYRLPSAIEWEYVARAGTDTLHWWGRDYVRGLSAPSGFTQSDYPTRAPQQGVFPANPWGFYNMYGAAAEWCTAGGFGRKTLRGGYNRLDSSMHNSFYDPRRFAHLHNGGIRLVVEATELSRKSYQFKSQNKDPIDVDRDH